MKGLTLFEVLVSLLIFSIIALGLGYAVVAGKSVLLVSDIPTQLRQNVLFALMPMVRELRQSASSTFLASFEEGTSSDSLRFQVSRYNIGTSVIDWGEPIIYARNGLNQLVRTCGGTTLVIAPNVTTLLFSRLAGEDALIQIDITVSKLDGQGNLYQDSVQQIVKMRN